MLTITRSAQPHAKKPVCGRVKFRVRIGLGFSLGIRVRVGVRVSATRGSFPLVRTVRGVHL